MSNEPIALPELEDPEAVKAARDTWNRLVRKEPFEFWKDNWDNYGESSLKDAVEAWSDHTEQTTDDVVLEAERKALAMHLSKCLPIPPEPWAVKKLAYDTNVFEVDLCAEEMSGAVQTLMGLAPTLLRLLRDTLIDNNPEAQREAFELVMRYRKLLP